MDITPQDNTTQSISDDQELAKALAGVLPEEPATTTSLEATPSSASVTVTSVPPATPPVAETPEFTMPPLPDVNTAAESTDSSIGSADASSLDGIKSQALTELRPLIDHVDLPPEERFDAYLMLLRSTDDSTLVAPAHAAAQSINDEKRKAEALLEIIKEIDYLSRKDA